GRRSGEGRRGGAERRGRGRPRREAAGRDHGDRRDRGRLPQDPEAAAARAALRARPPGPPGAGPLATRTRVDAPPRRPRREAPLPPRVAACDLVLATGSRTIN